MNLSDLLPVSEPAIGSIVLAETSPGDDYIAADGLARLRASYPDLAEIFTPTLVPPERSFFHEDDRSITGSDSNIKAAASMSPDSRYLLVQYTVSPWFLIFDLSSGALIKIPDPADTPASAVLASSWSSDSRYVAVGYSTAPHFDVYDLASGTPVRLTRPTSPGAAVSGVAFSPDGSRIAAITPGVSPYVHFFDMLSGAPVKMSNPAGLPSGAVAGRLAWSPNGQFLAMSNGPASPHIVFYEMQSGIPVKLANPASLPGAAIVTNIAWHASGRYCAMGINNTSPYQKVYDLNTGAPVSVTGTFSIPSGTPFGLAWVGDILVAVCGTSPTYVSFTSVSAGVVSAVTNSQGQPALAPAASVIVDPLGKYIGWYAASSPYNCFYSLEAGAVTAKFTVTSDIFLSGYNTLLWSPDGYFIITINNTGPAAPIHYSMLVDVNPWTEFKVPLIANGWVKAT